MLKHSLKGSAGWLLEPHERIAEVLFGLIMVLTFTGSLSIAEAGRAEIRSMLIGALGCNVAWGIIDGILYLMGCLAEKGKALLTLRAMRKTTDPQKARQFILNAMPPLLASVLQPTALESMRQRLKELPDPPASTRLDLENWLGALSVFLWVFFATFPVAIPFIFMQNANLALFVSNSIAILMLFILGHIFGRIVSHHPWIMGISMVAIGSLLVALTKALGG
jgi:hypothetical protein